MPEVDVHRTKEDVWEVGSGEENCHLAVGFSQREEVDHAFVHWSVEVEDSQGEDEDVCKYRGQDGQRVLQITQKRDTRLSKRISVGQHDCYTHKVCEVGIFDSSEASDGVDSRYGESDHHNSSSNLCPTVLMAVLLVVASHNCETNQAHDVDKCGHKW